MELFDLPSMVSTLSLAYVTGVMTGAEASIGFPSLYTLPHTAVLGFHGVNVRGSESRHKMMLVHSKNPYEDTKTELIAQKMVGKRMLIGWAFSQDLRSFRLETADHFPVQCRYQTLKTST